MTKQTAIDWDSINVLFGKVDGALKDIEREHNIHVIYACESGSRAWGFESPDSDYDIRFLYIRNPDFYRDIISPRKRDVLDKADGLDAIAHKYHPDFDMAGWDLIKVMRLMYCSNPALVEWLHSPTVYYDAPGIGSQLRSLMTHCLSRKALAHHYIHMARSNQRDYLRADRVRLKKYLYVLRPVLMLDWMMNVGGYALPIDFNVLLEDVEDGINPYVMEEIHNILSLKAESSELGETQRILALDGLIDQVLEAATHYAQCLDHHRGDPKLLNRFFWDVVESQQPGGVTAYTRPIIPSVGGLYVRSDDLVDVTRRYDKPLPDDTE